MLDDLLTDTTLVIRQTNNVLLVHGKPPCDQKLPSTPQNQQPQFLALKGQRPLHHRMMTYKDLAFFSPPKICQRGGCIPSMSFLTKQRQKRSSPPLFFVVYSGISLNPERRQRSTR